MQDYRKLEVWKDSHQLVKDVYTITEKLPGEERFHLKKQIRSSATSIPTNLVEGCGRYTQREKAQFFQISYASACELEYQLFLLSDLSYIDASEYERFLEPIDRIKRRLYRLIETVRKTLSRPKKNPSPKTQDASL